MRASDFLITIGAALVGVVACNAEPDLGHVADGGSDGSADGGSDVSPEATSGEDGGPDGSSGIDGANCGTLAIPNAWPNWVMPNPVRSGLPNPASYEVSDSGNQVTDKVTGLVWQRNVDGGKYTWEGAEQHCACFTVDGVAGWRLPSRIELASIADWTTANPSIDSSAFPKTPSESFWSSTGLSSDPLLAYLVFFGSGHTSYAELGYEYNARCVRQASAPAPPGRYTIANGTAYDAQTKLTWQQAISETSYTWADANAYCSGLSLDGAGWRVPTIGEMQTIVDESTNPSIDGAVFPSTPSTYFWSSSSVVLEDPPRAWVGFFTNGSTYSFVVTKLWRVRCVR